jgi:hypothetical protein
VAFMAYTTFSSTTIMTLTGFEYASLVFFIFLAQAKLLKNTPSIPIITFMFGGLTLFFMIVGK